VTDHAPRQIPHYHHIQPPLTCRIVTQSNQLPDGNLGAASNADDDHGTNPCASTPTETSPNVPTRRWSTALNTSA